MFYSIFENKYIIVINTFTILLLFLIYDHCVTIIQQTFLIHCNYCNVNYLEMLFLYKSLTCNLFYFKGRNFREWKNSRNFWNNLSRISCFCIFSEN